jgi:hypothetical protein
MDFPSIFPTKNTDVRIPKYASGTFLYSSKKGIKIKIAELARESNEKEMIAHRNFQLLSSSENEICV